MPDTRFALAAVLLLSSACLDTDPPPEVGSDSREANVNVIWTNLVGVQTVGAGNGLKKTGTNTAWDAAATSAQTIGGHGFVRFASNDPNDQTLAKAIGLSNGSAGQHIADIDYAMYLRDDGSIYEYQNGTSMGPPIGEYGPGDIFQIEATPSSVVYKKKVGGSYTTLRTTSVPGGLDFPLLVDTSLRDPGATFGNVVINEDPKIHVAVQNHFLVPGFDLNCGVNDVLSIGGSHFLHIEEEEPTTEDYLAFDDQTVDALAQRLAHYRDQQSIPANFGGTIIMDIENPHPKELYLRNAAEKAAIIEGYKRRIIATRLVFQNPSLKLGLYGTLVPDGQGEDPVPRPNPPTPYQQSHDALVDAGEDGLFNAVITADGYTEAGVDYLFPVLYIRFGCDGPPPATCDPHFDTIEAYTILGITGSRDIRRSDGSSIPLRPLLSVWVANAVGYSLFAKEALRDLGVATQTDPFPGTLRLQMEKFKAYGEDDVILWTGGYTDGAIRDGNGVLTSWDINDYTCWL